MVAIVTAMNYAIDCTIFFPALSKLANVISCGGLARKAWRDHVEGSPHRTRTLEMPATSTRPRVGVQSAGQVWVGTDDRRMPKKQSGLLKNTDVNNDV